LRLWPKLFKGFREVKVFFISLSLIVLFFIAAIFFGIYLRSDALMFETIRDEARSYFDLILQTRIWNAQHGGVYVEKKEGVGSNLYLKEVGIEPDIVCSNNRVLTMRNPALMTKEISQLIGKRSGVRFHITSLKPINSENSPDRFERDALLEFEGGKKEVSSVDRTIVPPLFRYMAPLSVEQSCLACHERQGYKVGDIRGGISVTIPLGGLEEKMRTNRIMLMLLLIFTVVLLMSTLYYMVWRLVLRLHESRKKLRHISITDELTGLRNRRYIMGRLGEEFQRARRIEKSLGVIMLDLDNCKQLNDLYGHQFGDVILRAVAKRMQSSLRDYDLVGRIGGEEFLIVSPDSDIEETGRIAERMRTIIRDEPIGDGSKEMTVTVSAGITMLRDEDRGIDALLRRADKALYRAKQEGRDRVASS